MILKRRIPSLLLAGIFLTLSSCADSINNLSSELFSGKGFTPSAMSQGGLGVLPTVPGEGSNAQAEIVTTLLNRQISKKIGSQRLLQSEEIERRFLKEKDLSVLWSKIAPHVSLHSVTGLGRTRSLGHSLGVRFLLETQIQMAEEAGGAEQVRIFARIFDTIQGKIVWEGVGEARGYVKLFFPSVPATFEETATVASGGIVSELFSD